MDSVYEFHYLNDQVTNTNSVGLSTYIIRMYVHREGIFEDCVVCSMHVYVRTYIRL